jgi:hypothetical protein
MNIKKISWNEKNFDAAYDLRPSMVDEDLGNKGLGAIVFIFCAVAILLPSSITLSQVINGDATGNPIGAVTAVILILGWPTYWGLSQFFLRRVFIIKNGTVNFEFISFFNRKSKSIKVSEYGMIETGQTRSIPRMGGGGGGDIGFTGVYFVRLSHENRKYTIDLYNKVSSQMEENRIESYSKLLNLPVKDITPELTTKDLRFKRKVKSMLENR